MSSRVIMAPRPCWSLAGRRGRSVRGTSGQRQGAVGTFAKEKVGCDAAQKELRVGKEDVVVAESLRRRERRRARASWSLGSKVSDLPLWSQREE